MEGTANSEKIVSIGVRGSIIFLLFSLLTGQLLRVPVLGQGGGLLVSDAAVFIFLAVSVFLLFFGSIQREELYFKIAWIASVPFILWSVLTLLIHSGVLEQKELLISLLYWMRTTIILLLYPLGILVIQNPKEKTFFKKALLSTYFALVVVGFFQLIFFPRLVDLGGGWDPHEYRMTSTWLDPNFFGAFLAMVIPALFLWISSKYRGVQVAFFAASLFGILFTKSRSTYVAITIALFFCFFCWILPISIPSKWKKIIPSLLLILSVGISLGIFILQERAIGVFMHDPTVSLRLEAYQTAWDYIIEKNFFFGVGYNAYQFAARDAGIISNSFMHSRSGSDSSIFTLLATTGILGTVLFFAPLLYGISFHIQRWFLKAEYSSLFFIWATIFLLAHSQFQNSLLYPHLLISYILIVLLTLW